MWSSVPFLPVYGNVVVHITILPLVSKTHNDLQGREELVQTAEEQRLDLRSLKPLVGLLCPGSASHWICMGYTEPAPDPGVTG